MSLVDNVIYVDGRRAVHPESLDQTVAELRHCPDADHSFCWIGLLRPTSDEVRAVAHEFGLHELAIEDAIDAHQRPKLELYGRTVFVVLRPAWYVDTVEVVEIGEVHLFLGPDFVVTLRHADQPDLADVRQRLEGDPELLRHGPFAVLDGLQTDIDEIEVQVFGGDPKVSRRIYQLTREVIEFQRAVEPLSDVLGELREILKDHASEADLELRRMLRDVADHATRVCERTEAFRQLLINILSVNAALVGQRQNEEMTRLTQASYQQGEEVKRVSSWAAILFTPTLVAGIYGMNFTHMPELNWALGYPMAVAAMALTGLVLFLAFKRKGWL